MVEHVGSRCVIQGKRVSVAGRGFDLFPTGCGGRPCGCLGRAALHAELVAVAAACSAAPAKFLPPETPTGLARTRKWTCRFCFQRSICTRELPWSGNFSISINHRKLIM